MGTYAVLSIQNCIILIYKEVMPTSTPGLHCRNILNGYQNRNP